MKKTNLISLVLALSAALTFSAGCNNGPAQSDGDTTGTSETSFDTTAEASEDTAAPAQTEPQKFANEPKPIVYPEFSGVVLSLDEEAFNTYDFAADGNTQVTDILIDSDTISADKLKEIEDNALLVWIATDFLEDRTAVKANVDRIISEYGAYIDGIEIDFTNVFGVNSFNGAEDGEIYYAAYFAITEFMGEIHNMTDAAGLRLSARVGSTLDTNADYGLDIPAWAAEGYVERVAPTAGGDATDTGMPIRLWASVLNTWDEENKPFVVELTPRIEASLYPYPDSPAVPQRRETVIGTAALMLAQGADKVCVDSSAAVDGVLSVIGSYDTAKAENRRLIYSVNPYVSRWSNTVNFPVEQSGLQAFVLHVPMGPVDADSTVVLKFTAPALGTSDRYPDVYVNSELCEYLGAEENPNPEISDAVHCYKIPAEAYGMYAVAEVHVKNAITVRYAEVAIEVAK